MSKNNNSKKFICDCGEKFAYSNSFITHKQRCLIHIEKWRQSNPTCENCGKPMKEYYGAGRFCSKECSYHIYDNSIRFLIDEELKQNWLDENHRCQRCGVIMTEKYGSGRFCSKACSNSRSQSEETKLKISASLKATDSAFMQNLNEKRNQILDQYSHNPSICVICGKPLPYNKRNRQTCSEDCLHKLFSIKNREKVIRHNGNINPHPNKKCKTGSYKGIHFDSSWELAFIVYHIDHSIPFERNTTGFKYSWKDRQHLYYPDFIINDEYYEIKNFWTPIVQAKLDQFPKNYNLKILYKSDMKPYLDYCIQTYGKDFYSALMRQIE